MSKHESPLTMAGRSGDRVTADGANKHTSISLRIGGMTCPHCCRIGERYERT
jgi:hypothetical protein